jgi:hypothetical protein
MQFWLKGQRPGFAWLCALRSMSFVSELQLPPFSNQGFFSVREVDALRRRSFAGVRVPLALPQVGLSSSYRRLWDVKPALVTAHYPCGQPDLRTMDRLDLCTTSTQPPGSSSPLLSPKYPHFCSGQDSQFLTCPLDSSHSPQDILTRQGVGVLGTI